MELIIDENSTTENQDVHLLPCKIHMDGPSKFSNYVKISKDEDTERKPLGQDASKQKKHTQSTRDIIDLLFFKLVILSLA
jgi:hypothetical protein